MRDRREKPIRTYIVTQPLYGHRTVVVEARTVAEALDIVADGGGESIDTNIHRIGRGKAFRESQP